MWLWSVLWRISALLLVSGTFNMGLFSQKRPYVPPPTLPINCFEYSQFGNHRFERAYNQDWSSRKPAIKTKMSGYLSTYPAKALSSNKMMTRRIDKLITKQDDLIKEHAKLVQDINSLKQVVFIPPFEDLRDVEYDESIFHDVIETFSTTSPRPTTKTTRPFNSNSFPIMLLGGESTRHAIRSQPMFFPKSTINLVGTTATPLLKHPYPFVMQNPSEKPIRICMSAITSYQSTARRPGLLERLIASVLPKGR